jgi:hypothetical protein
VDSKRVKRRFRGCLAAVVIAALCIEIVVMWSLVVLSQQTADWPTTTGHVIAIRNRAPRGTAPGTRVYRYSVAGNQYVGEEAALGIIGISDGWAYERLRVGDTVTVYYDPQQPGNALLYPGHSLSTVVLLVILTALLLFGSARIIVQLNA